MPGITRVQYPKELRKGWGTLNYQASGSNEGLFSHRQAAQIRYVQVSAAVGEPTGWPPTCEVKSYFQLRISTTVIESIYTWSPPGYSGVDVSCEATSGQQASSFSACNATSAFNSFVCGETIVESLDSSTGTGTEGIITIEEAVQTRLALGADLESYVSQLDENVMIPSPIGDDHEWKDSAAVLSNIITFLNNSIKTGGLEKWDTQNPGAINYTNPIPTYAPWMICGDWTGGDPNASTTTTGGTTTTATNTTSTYSTSTTSYSTSTSTLTTTTAS